jgi:hypothetical protein
LNTFSDQSEAEMLILLSLIFPVQSSIIQANLFGPFALKNLQNLKKQDMNENVPHTRQPPLKKYPNSSQDIYDWRYPQNMINHSSNLYNPRMDEGYLPASEFSPLGPSLSVDSQTLQFPHQRKITNAYSPREINNLNTGNVHNGDYASFLSSQAYKSDREPPFQIQPRTSNNYQFSPPQYANSAQSIAPSRLNLHQISSNPEIENDLKLGMDYNTYSRNNFKNPQEQKPQAIQSITYAPFLAQESQISKSEAAFQSSQSNDSIDPQMVPPKQYIQKASNFPQSDNFRNFQDTSINTRNGIQPQSESETNIGQFTQGR